MFICQCNNDIKALLIKLPRIDRVFWKSKIYVIYAHGKK